MDGVLSQAERVQVMDQGWRFHTQRRLISVGNQTAVIQRRFHWLIKAVVRLQQAPIPLGIQALGKKRQALFQRHMQQARARAQRFQQGGRTNVMGL